MLLCLFEVLSFKFSRKKAGAIITNRGGRTCHAAIIARELGIPAIVGCGDATDKVKKGRGMPRDDATGDLWLIGFEVWDVCDSKIRSYNQLGITTKHIQT